MKVGSAPGSRTDTGRLPLWGAAVVVVGLLHVGLAVVLGQGKGAEAPEAPEAPAVPIWVELVKPKPVPPPPEPEPQPRPQPGGGEPAGSSRVHLPPSKPIAERELPIVPVEQAPEPALVVGVAPQLDPAPGLGQGGTGDGTGNGLGSGDGPGQGRGPAFLRGASNGEVLSLMPRELARRRGGGRSEVSCIIGYDTRLRDCQIVSERPAGLGYGQVAIRVTETFFRFRPPTSRNGEDIEGQRVTVGIDFPGR